MKEGILSIDIDNESKTVSFNPNFQYKVNTKNLKIFPAKHSFEISIPDYPNEKTACSVISIFGKQNLEENSNNTNSVLEFAFKNKCGWRFSTEYDCFQIILQVTTIAAKLFENPQIDSVIYPPSVNKLNELIARVFKRVHRNAAILSSKELVEKLSDEVFEKLYDYDWIKYILGLYDNRCKSWNNINPKWNRFIDTVENELSRYRSQMGNIFSYRNLPVEYRQAIPRSAELGEFCQNDVIINDRNIAIVDNTLNIGNALSGTSKFILNCYKPKNITFITLFPTSKCFT